MKQTISILNYPSSKFTVGNSDFVGNFHRNLACLFIIVIQKFAPAYHKEQGKHKPRDRSARCVFFFFLSFSAGLKVWLKVANLVILVVYKWWQNPCCGCYMWIPGLELDHDKYVPEQENMGSKL